MSASSSSSHIDCRILRLLVARSCVLIAAVLCSSEAHAEDSSLQIDKSQSRLEVLVNTTTGSFVARVPDYDLVISAAVGTGRILSARFQTKFAAIKTGIEGRDNDMNKWQQTDKFPQIEFTLVSLEPAGGAAYTAKGHLRLHGVDHLVTFPITYTGGHGFWAVDGDAPLDTKTFGLPVITMFVMLKVDPVVRVRFHLQGNFPK